MTELAIAMPARNSEHFIGQAIESVLSQKDVDFHLYIVDDASRDRTFEVARSYDDPRITLFQNERRKGIGYCHNLVLSESHSPIIAHVDSDDFIRQGALKKMVNALRNHPNAGMAHCYDVDVNERGTIQREQLRKSKQQLLKSRPPGRDYKVDLVLRGCVINHLRTYRREALDCIGTFNETLKVGEDYDMALRIVDKFQIILVPEILYFHRLHKNNASEYLLFRKTRSIFNNYTICSRLAKSGRVKHLKDLGFRLHLIMAARYFRRSDLAIRQLKHAKKNQ